MEAGELLSATIMGEALLEVLESSRASNGELDEAAEDGVQSAQDAEVLRPVGAVLAGLGRGDA